MLYTADFETTTDKNDCRVWAWGVCEIGKPEFFEYGNTIEGFIEFCKNHDKAVFYFHNEKFDGEFIFSYLFKNGYRHTREKHEKDTKTFNTLISDTGLFYSIEIVFERKGKKYRSVKILDSLKIIPFSVDAIAKTFGLPINKLEIDYNEFREIGHELTKQEIDYLRNDVEITARALKIMFDQGLTKMTQGANALEDYKTIVGKRNFNRWFPMPDLMMDMDLRQSYRGGFTYCMPGYKSKSILEGLVFDVNSLYPWVMYECLLPYDNPIPFEGEYVYDENYPLYIQMIKCDFELKENHIPSVQIKNGGYGYIQNEYLTSSELDGHWKTPVMCMTNVDFELFKDHYEIYNPVFLKGWKFRGSVDLFKPYINKWMNVKIESTKNGNKGMRTSSKLMLNSLYGKFGVNPKCGSKFPYFSEGLVKYETHKECELRDALYIPVASFVTAYAREKTIRTAQKLYDYFVYADTDSLHLRIDVPQAIKDLPQKQLEKLTTQDLINYGMKLPKDFEVDPVALGAWKLESCFNRARFLRQKCYIEDSNPENVWNEPYYSSKSLSEFCEECGLDFKKEMEKFSTWYDRDKFKVTCSGMPSRCYGYVNWDNFRIHSTFRGKLKPTRVEGGIVLVEDVFTIRPS